MWNRILGLGEGCFKQKEGKHTHLWERVGDIAMLGFWNWLIGRHCFICSKCNKRINAW